MVLAAAFVGVERRNSLFLSMWDRICIFIGIVIFIPDLYIFHSNVGSEVVSQNCQVMVTSLGCCCR